MSHNSTSYNKKILSESYSQSIIRITGSETDDTSSFYILNRILKKRKQSWDSFFKKYSDMSDEIILNISTLEPDKEDVNQYFSKRRVCMRKSMTEVQHWVNTGTLLHNSLTEQNDRTLTCSSLSEHEIEFHSPNGLTVLHKLNNKQESSISSSCSSVDTAAYILSNTNINRKTETTGLKNAKRSHERGCKIISCNNSLSKWVIKDKSSQANIQTTPVMNNINSSIELRNINLKSGLFCEKYKSTSSVSDEENAAVIRPRQFVEQPKLSTLQQASRISDCLNVINQSNASPDPLISVTRERQNSFFSKTTSSSVNKSKTQRRKLFTDRTSPVDLIIPVHINTRILPDAARSWHPALKSSPLIKRNIRSFGKIRRSRRRKGTRKTLLLSRTIIKENGSSNSTSNSLNLTPITHPDKLTPVEDSIKDHIYGSTITKTTEKTVFSENEGLSNQPILSNIKGISDSTNTNIKDTKERICEDSLVNLNPMLLIERLSTNDLAYCKLESNFMDDNKVNFTSELSKNFVLRTEENNSCKKSNLINVSSSECLNKLKELDLSVDISSINADSVYSDQSTIIMYPPGNNLKHSFSFKQSSDSSFSEHFKSSQNEITCLKLMNEKYNRVLEKKPFVTDKKLNPIVVLERLKMMDEHKRYNAEQDIINCDKNYVQSDQEIFGPSSSLLLENNILSECTRDRTVARKEINKELEVPLINMPITNNSCHSSPTESYVKQINSYKRIKDDFKNIHILKTSYLPKKKYVTSEAKSVIISSDTCRSVQESTPGSSKKLILCNNLELPNSNVSSKDYTKIKGNYDVEETDRTTENSVKHFSKSSQNKFVNDSCCTIGTKYKHLSNSLTSPSCNNKSELIGQKTNDSKWPILFFKYSSDEENSFVKLVERCRSTKRLKTTLNNNSTDKRSIDVRDSGQDRVNITNGSEKVNKNVDFHNSKFINVRHPKILNSNNNNCALKMKKIDNKLIKSEEGDLTENNKNPDETTQIQKISIMFSSALNNSKSNNSSSVISKRKRISSISCDGKTDDDEKVAKLKESSSNDNKIIFRTSLNDTEIDTESRTLATKRRSINNKNVLSSSDDSEKLNVPLQNNKNSYSLRNNSETRNSVLKKKIPKYTFISSDEESDIESLSLFTKSKKSELTTATRLHSLTITQNEKCTRELFENRLKATKQSTSTSSLNNSNSECDDDSPIFNVTHRMNNNKRKNDESCDKSTKVNKDKRITEKKLITFRTRMYDTSDSDET